MFKTFSKGFMMNTVSKEVLEVAIERGAYLTAAEETCVLLSEVGYLLKDKFDMEKQKQFHVNNIRNFNEDNMLVYETAKLYLTDIMTPEFVDSMIAIDRMTDVSYTMSEGNMTGIVKEYTDKAKAKIEKEDKEKKIQEAKNQIKALASLIAELEA